MNTRLQVEHPVTEAITGLDLVEWQLRVAAGEPLPRRAEQIMFNGHSIEARVYAEDPAHDFRPSTGVITHLEASLEQARVDTGVRKGDSISVYYDPLIAKLIVWAPDRGTAISRLRGALAQYQVAGVTTNIPFLAAVAAHPAYQAGQLDTGFLERHAAVLLPAAQPASREILAAALLAVLAEQRRKAGQRAAASGDPWSPWNQLSAWRLNGAGYQDLVFTDGTSTVPLRVFPQRDGTFRVDFPDGPGEISERKDARFLDGVKIGASGVLQGAQVTVFAAGATHSLSLIDPWAARGVEEDAGGRLTAPMPGRVVQVMVQKGAVVNRGAPLLILEAMKMEYTIAAPADGRIAEVHYSPGDVVEEGAELIKFAE
jgi:3-methylcrotonyl-CoA carboxylase alpha subunit